MASPFTVSIIPQPNQTASTAPLVTQIQNSLNNSYTLFLNQGGNPQYFLPLAINIYNNYATNYSTFIFSLTIYNNGAYYWSSTGSSSGSSGSTGLYTVLGVKTVGFTASTGNFYRLDSSGGAFSVGLPVSPTDGSMVGFVLSNGSNTITFTGGTILGGVLTMSVAGSYCVLQYNATTTNWEQVQ
jgi:hypothetical protein